MAQSTATVTRIQSEKGIVKLRPFHLREEYKSLSEIHGTHRFELADHAVA